MFYFQKFLIVLFVYSTSIIAMKKNDKAIIPIFAKTSNGTANKSTFVPTDNTPQANADLLKILASRQIRAFLQAKHWEKIKECLKNGADPNIKTFNHSQTPLIYLAVEHDKKDIFDYLLQLGADINAYDTYRWTPLHVFMSNFNNPINISIEYLLQKGANPNAINSNKETPFSLALSYKHFNFIQPLIQYRANVNYSNGWITSLGQAIINSYDENDQNKQKSSINVIKLLCKTGASPINLDNYDNTAFHRAANKPEKIIETLITHINIKNNNNDLTNIIKTVLLVFHRLKNDRNSNIFNIPPIPYDIQILILSKLLSIDSFHQGLYKQCKGERYYKLHLELVNNHIECLKQILQIKNKENKTALELLPKDPTDISANECLLNGIKLQEDLDILNKKYPDTTSISADNLARQILENHYTF